ncbi:unnamed protein product [Urochloa humidicola]
MNDLMTKSFMSYVDLKKAAMKDLEAGGDGIEVPEAGAAGVTDERLRGFFQEADAVNAEMAAIRDALDRLHAANEEGKSLQQADALRAHRGRVNADIVAVLHRARGIRAALESLDRANAAQRRLSAGCREGTPLDRTRTAVTAGLRKKLRDLMLDFQALRQRMMSEYKETVERRYYALTGEVPEEEVIERIISDGRGEELLGAAVAEHGKGAVLAAVHEIQDRHDAAREVERSLLELHQVFLDMAVMVETQGDKLDDIETSRATSQTHPITCRAATRSWARPGSTSGAAASASASASSSCCSSYSSSSCPSPPASGSETRSGVVNRDDEGGQVGSNSICWVGGFE